MVILRSTLEEPKRRSHDLSLLGQFFSPARLSVSVSRLLTVLERTGEFTQVYCSPVAILCLTFFVPFSVMSRARRL